MNFGLSSGISFGIFVPLAFSFAHFTSAHFLFWFSPRGRILSFFASMKICKTRQLRFSVWQVNVGTFSVPVCRFSRETSALPFSKAIFYRCSNEFITVLFLGMFSFDTLHLPNRLLICFKTFNCIFTSKKRTCS